MNQLGRSFFTITQRRGIVCHHSWPLRILPAYPTVTDSIIHRHQDNPLLLKCINQQPSLATLHFVFLMISDDQSPQIFQPPVKWNGNLTLLAQGYHMLIYVKS